MQQGVKQAIKQGLTREEIARVVANDIPEGAYVNLGIGLPTKIANYVPREREVQLQSEQGLLGLGPAPVPGQEDPDVVNAGKGFVTLLPGASVFSHSDSFLMIRGGHIDIACLGAFQVASNGDIANWSTGSDKVAPGVGGAMDLAAGARQVWVLMEHCQKDGGPRVLEHCTYPLTGTGCVSRIYTNFALITVTGEGLQVDRLVRGMTLESLQAITGAKLKLSEHCTVYSPV